MRITDPSTQLPPEVTFRFRQLVPLVIWQSIMLIVVGLIAGLAFEQQGIGSALAIVGVASMIFMLSGIAMIAFSNIVVGPDGVSRSLFGRVIQRISWQEVALITFFPSPGRAFNGAGIAVNVIANSKQWGILPRKTWFSERAENIAEIIAALNYYITLFKIEVHNTVSARR